MRNKLQTLLFILTAALFFTSCQKEETLETFDSISGVLSAGEDMTAEDLNGLEIYLGKFHDSVNFDNITFKTTAIDSLAATTLNADGSFSFNNLALGNYALVMKNGFIFSLDTALSINLNENNEYFIEKKIDRLPEENFRTPPIGPNRGGSREVCISNFKKKNIPSKYQIKYLYCYFDSIAHQAIDFPEFETYKSEWPLFSWQVLAEDGSLTSFIYPIEAAVTFELEIWTYDDNGNVIDKQRSARVQYHAFTNKTSPTLNWPGNPVDITWVAYYKKVTGKWWWKKTIEEEGHYLIEMHK